MRTLYLDCGMGAAGDMLAAALLELLPDQSAFLARLNALGIPGVMATVEPSVKCGITGTHFRVVVDGQEEDEGLHNHSHHHHDHHHHEAHHHEADDHETHDHHKHHHEHHHGSMAEIKHIVAHLPLSDAVRSDILAVYTLIAQAESQVHGVSIQNIHFHEVGTMDALADITAVCMLMEELKPEQILASNVHVGCGSVRCAHGILPVPAPATALLLKDIPIYGGRIEGELCTPTGAALLRHFVSRFGEMPPMTTQAIGYGMGKKDFSKANCVRAFLGTSGAQTHETVVELSCNLDDMTGEDLGYAQELLLSLGALDVFTQPIGMKKSRPGTMLTVLCRESDRETMVKAIFANTSTLGIRESLCRRYTLDRQVETKQTPYGPVRFKTAMGYGQNRRKPEYEDLAAIARENGISLDTLRRELTD